MKNRKELTESIVKSVSGIQSVYYLKKLLEISEIIRKALDDEEYAELSELQWKQRSAILDILSIKDSEVCADVNTFVSVYIRK